MEKVTKNFLGSGRESYVVRLFHWEAFDWLKVEKKLICRRMT